jgi:hypothetical protein
MCLVGDFNNMKASLKISFNSLASELMLMLLCSCSTAHSDALKEELPRSNSVIVTNVIATNTISLKKDELGAERIFTNANVVMWVPANAKRIWDGPTSSVHVGRKSPP